MRRRGGIVRPRLRRRGAPEASGGGGVSFRSFRSVDQGGPYVAGQTRVHIAGLNAINAGSGLAAMLSSDIPGGAAGQMLVAIPEFFDEAGTVARLVGRTNGAIGIGADPRFKYGVYADGQMAAGIFARTPFPGALLAQSDNEVVAGNGLFETLLSLDVEDGEQLWFTFVANPTGGTNGYTIPGLRCSSLYPISGYTYNVTLPTTIAEDALTYGVGWRHAFAYTLTEDLPDPFPQSAPVLLQGATHDAIVVPALGFGWVPA